MEQEQLIRIVEGALLAAGKPLTVQQLSELFEEGERPENEQLRQALDTLTEQCSGRGFELRQVASGYRFQVVEDIAPWVGRLWEEKPQRYSRALLETLALIAYRQPITRGDIEDIRGVAVSSQIIKTLLEREWVRVVGHKDVPGRPAMYATTRKFLDYFNLRNLDDLPALADIKDLDSLTGELGFDVQEMSSGSEGQEQAEQDSAEVSSQAELPTEVSEDHKGTEDQQDFVAAGIAGATEDTGESHKYADDELGGADVDVEDAGTESVESLDENAVDLEAPEADIH